VDHTLFLGKYDDGPGEEINSTGFRNEMDNNKGKPDQTSYMGPSWDGEAAFAPTNAIYDYWSSAKESTSQEAIWFQFSDPLMIVKFSFLGYTILGKKYPPYGDENSFAFFLFQC
jgi:hypothetical protein